MTVIDQFCGQLFLLPWVPRWERLESASGWTFGASSPSPLSSGTLVKSPLRSVKYDIMNRKQLPKRARPILRHKSATSVFLRIFTRFSGPRAADVNVPGVCFFSYS